MSGFRRAFDHPRLLPLTALALRARTVRETSSFVARELAGRGGAYAYTLRGGSTRVVVRHNSGDPVTLGEVFHEHDYEPPAAVPELRPETIIDLGANVGYFGAFALQRWPGARVIAYEPDPENFAVHRRAIELNDFGDRWQVRRVAAGNRARSIRFHASADALSHASESGDLLVDAEDVLPLLAGADLVKIDIEGGEWTILGDPRFVDDPPRCLVLEYHPHPSVAGDPAAAAIERIRAAGLEGTVAVSGRADGYGMLWAWQP